MAVAVPVVTVTPTAAVMPARARRAAPPVSSSLSSVVASAVAVPRSLATLRSKRDAALVPAPTTLFRRPRARRTFRLLINGRWMVWSCLHLGRKRGPFSVGVSG